MRTKFILTLSLCLLGLVFGQQQQQTETAETEQQMQQVSGNGWLRFANGYSESNPVDVYIDNLPVASWNWVPFRQVTAYQPIISGMHTISLVRANASRMEQEMEQQTSTEEQQQQSRQAETEQTDTQQTDQQMAASEEFPPLSQLFSSEDIVLEASFQIDSDLFYSFAWFAAADQQQQNGLQTEQTEGQQLRQQETEQQTEQPQQTEETGQPEQQPEMQQGLIQSTSTWALYIDRLESFPGQARIRWINLVEDFPQVSVFLERADQKRQQEEAVAESLQFLQASPYASVVPGVYNIIIRSAQAAGTEQQTSTEQQGTEQAGTEQQGTEQAGTEQQTGFKRQAGTEQETEQQAGTEQQIGTEQAGTEQPQQQQGEEIRRIERVQLLAGSSYSGWIFGPLDQQSQLQEGAQVAAILKFDNFELIRMLQV